MTCQLAIDREQRRASAEGRSEVTMAMRHAIQFRRADDQIDRRRRTAPVDLGATAGNDRRLALAGRGMKRCGELLPVLGHDDRGCRAHVGHQSQNRSPSPAASTGC